MVQPAPLTEYIQQKPARQYWFYCTNPQGYYPYVKDCSVGWMRVLPQLAAAPAPPAPAPGPSAPTSVPPAPPATTPPVERLTLHINVGTDKAVIRPGDRAELQRALEFVKQYPGHNGVKDVVDSVE